MKKLVLMFVTMVAITFASCGNKTAGVDAQDSTSVDSVLVDSVVADSVK